MHVIRPLLRPLARLLLATYCATSMLPLAQAGMVGTATVLEEADADRAGVLAALHRADVRAKLVAHGVDPAAAVARVNAMSEADVRRLAADFEADPAGGAIVEALLILFAALAFVHAMSWDDALFGDAEAAPAQ